MRRALLLAAVGVGLVTAGVFADCNCVSTQSGIPECYTSFWSGEAIPFRLVVPGEFFARPDSPSAVFVVGWRVEAMDRTILVQESFSELPLGHWYVVVWDGRDSTCRWVSAGYYRVVIVTDAAGEFSSYVQIVDPPCACVRPRGPLCSRPCPSACGVPYVAVDRPGGTSSCGFSILIQLGCGCP